MNYFFIAAGALAFIVGLVHSVLGERLVFRRLRDDKALVTTVGGSLLHEAHVRILWATWHATTVLGWCVAAILVWLALPAAGPAPLALTAAIVAAMSASAALVLVGTRGKHPGWVGLSGVALLTWMGHFAQTT